MELGEETQGERQGVTVVCGDSGEETRCHCGVDGWQVFVGGEMKGIMGVVLDLIILGQGE